jgi:predicted dehydrogenase
MIMSSQDTGFSRRDFIRGSSLAAAGALVLPAVHVAGAVQNDLQVKIGLVGCGGRGTGAALNAMGAATKVIYPAAGYHTEDPDPNAKIARPNIKVVALADVFEDRLNTCRSRMQQVGCEIAKEHCYIGFDAYKKLVADPEVNYVILATPPHFRAMQLQAAIEAGKHVFMEKPVAVDVPGVKMVMAAAELAKQKNLGIAAGTQRRHQKSYIETIQRIRDGAIGQIVYAKCYWNGGQIWVIQRQEGWSDLEWQLRNWNYFTWLAGDHYVEQHVHNLDIMNWVLGTHPIRAVAAVGGRQVRTAPVYGQVYDHFAVEYEYPGGISMFSQARQIDGCDNLVNEFVVASGGTSNCANLIQPKNGAAWRYKGESPNPYEQEHQDLIASIRAGKPINDAPAIAESTMTGREAAYSGRAITWEDAMKSTRRLGPEKYEFGPYPVPPVAMPGQYRFS